MTTTFEKLHATATYVAIPSTLALYASGRTTGLVVMLGNNSSVIFAIYEGYALPTSKQQTISGLDITKQLYQLVTHKDTPSERDLIVFDVRNVIIATFDSHLFFLLELEKTIFICFN